MRSKSKVFAVAISSKTGEVFEADGYREVVVVDEEGEEHVKVTDRPSTARSRVRAQIRAAARRMQRNEECTVKTFKAGEQIGGRTCKAWGQHGTWLLGADRGQVEYTGSEHETNSLDNISVQ